ncbi:MAG: glutamate racemase [Lachnospiraceae bacterium]
MECDKRPVAVFDSGLGGISVLREMVKLLPNEDYLYFGDTKHAPYGTKTKEEVRILSENNVEMLLKKGAKAIVIACNTATSAAAASLREKYKEIPIIGIEPAVRPAVLHKKDSNILVMATTMTLQEEKFHHLMEQYTDGANIIPMPCPGLMEFVERGVLEGEELEQYFTKLFQDIDKESIDAIVLGCTHYPFIKESLRPFFRKDVYIIDGGYGTAKELGRRLREANLQNEQNHKGSVCFFSSADEERFSYLAKRLLSL